MEKEGCGVQLRLSRMICVCRLMYVGCMGMLSRWSRTMSASLGILGNWIWRKGWESGELGKCIWETQGSHLLLYQTTGETLFLTLLHALISSQFLTGPSKGQRRERNNYKVSTQPSSNGNLPMGQGKDFITDGVTDKKSI